MAQPTGRPASLPRRLQWPAAETATQPQSIFRERCILSVYGNVSPIFYLASHRKLQATWRTEVIVWRPHHWGLFLLCPVTTCLLLSFLQLPKLLHRYGWHHIDIPQPDNHFFYIFFTRLRSASLLSIALQPVEAIGTRSFVRSAEDIQFVGDDLCSEVDGQSDLGSQPRSHLAAERRRGAKKWLSYFANHSAVISRNRLNTRWSVVRVTLWST